MGRHTLTQMCMHRQDKGILNAWFEVKKIAHNYQNQDVSCQLRGSLCFGLIIMLGKLTIDKADMEFTTEQTLDKEQFQLELFKGHD